MSEDNGFSLQEMFSEKLSLSPFRSHLSEHVVPSSLFCNRKDCGQITSMFAESEHHAWSCDFLAWISLAIMILLIAGGCLIIIRRFIKFRYAVFITYSSGLRQNCSKLTL